MDYLFIPCPCCAQGPSYYWYHNCGSKVVLVYEDLDMMCSGCYYRNDVFEWYFKCGGDAHQDYRKAGKNGFIYALMMMTQRCQDTQHLMQIAIRKLY